MFVFFRCRASKPVRRRENSARHDADVGLYARWPVIENVPLSMVKLAGWMLAEAGIGLANRRRGGVPDGRSVMAAQAISTNPALLTPHGRS